ncbi:uncharacterized protein TNCV_1154601 [Trichonephila clavipes]|nr:uncharacterized protein TNCV_1154601 [Trichonephila clavipes]
MVYNYNNIFFAKKDFTFGLRTVKSGEIHLIQTTQVPMLIYELPASSLKCRAQPNVIRRRFEPHDQMLYHRTILEPHTAYPTPAGTNYIVLTVQKTAFGLDIIPESLLPQIIQKGFHVGDFRKMKKFNQTPYKLPPTTPIHVPAEKRPLEEKSLSKKRVRITPVMRRVSRRFELPMAPMQFPDVLEPVQIPLVPQSPVEIPDVLEPVQIPDVIEPVQIPDVLEPVQIPDVLEPVQIPLVPQSPVQIPVSQVPELPVQIPVLQVPEPPVQIPLVQIPDVPEHVQIPVSHVSEPPVQIPPVQIPPVQIPPVQIPPVQIPPMQIPLVHIPVSHVSEPPVQIPVSQDPQLPVQIPDVPEHVQILVSQISQPPVQILHVSEPVQIPDVPELVQIPVSQVPQPPMQILPEPMNILHVSEPVQIPDVPEAVQIPVPHTHKSHSHLCRFHLCRVSQNLCSFSQSSTFWTLWSRQMHSTSSCRSYLDPKNSSCFTRYPLFLMEISSPSWMNLKGSLMDLTMPRENSCVKKSIGPIQPMDLSVNSCL